MPFPPTSTVLEASVEIESKSRRLLTEVAFLACIVNDVARARRIARGLAASKKGGWEADIAFAVADLTEGDIDAALKRLRPLAEMNDVYAMVFQGLGLHRAGRIKERDAVLQRIPSGDLAVDGFWGRGGTG